MHTKESLQKLQAMPGASADVLAEAALVAESLDDLTAAIAFYDRALASPDAPNGMALAATKNNLAFALCRRANGATAAKDLARARTLADDAIRTAEIAPFYDTLGWITAALEDRVAATTAFRRAIALDGKSLSAVIGLADILSRGGQPEKAEAAALAVQADALIKNGASLSEFGRSRYDQLKARLAGH
jgi:lipopolysaccharide biosynthesis regulator YciM